MSPGGVHAPRAVTYGKRVSRFRSGLVAGARISHNGRFTKEKFARDKLRGESGIGPQRKINACSRIGGQQQTAGAPGRRPDSDGQATTFGRTDKRPICAPVAGLPFHSGRPGGPPHACSDGVGDFAFGCSGILGLQFLRSTAPAPKFSDLSHIHRWQGGEHVYPGAGHSPGDVMDVFPSPPPPPLGSPISAHKMRFLISTRMSSTSFPQVHRHHATVSGAQHFARCAGTGGVHGRHHPLRPANLVHGSGPDTCPAPADLYAKVVIPAPISGCHNP